MNYFFMQRLAGGCMPFLSFQGLYEGRITDAAASGSHEVAQTLLEHNAEVNARNAHGSTPSLSQSIRDRK